MKQPSDSFIYGKPFLSWLLFIAISFGGVLPVYLYGYFAFPERGHFLGIVFNPSDTSQYLALARQYQDHNLLVCIDPFTTQEHSPFLIQPFLSLVGVLARLTTLPCELLYPSFGVILGVLTLAVAWRLCLLLLPSRQEAIWAWMFLTFAGGANSLLSLWRLFKGEDIIQGIYMPRFYETWNLFGTMVGSPMRICQYLLILTFWTFCLERELNLKRRPVWLIGSVLLLAGFCHPYDVPFLLLQIALRSAWSAVSNRTWRDLLRDSKLIFFGLPCLIHAFLVITLHPVGLTFGRIPQEVSSLIWGLWWMTGAMLPGTFFWLIIEGREGRFRSAQSRFLAIAIITVFIIRQLPVVYGGRLTEPFFLAVIFTGVSGWFRFFCGLTQKAQPLLKPFPVSLPSLALAVIWTISIPATIVAHGEKFIQISTNDRPGRLFYLADDEWDMIKWMNSNLKSEGGVLASRQIGVHLPRLTGRSVFSGHPVLTPNYYFSRVLVDAFFVTDSMTDDRRHRFMERENLRYLYFGRQERDLGDYDPTRSPIFRILHREGGVFVLELR